MAISFLRVDNRMIHGQITTRWAKEVKCDGCVVVDDTAAKNAAIVAAFKSCMDRPVFVLSYDDFCAKKENILKSEKNYFLITREPVMMAKMIVDDDLPVKDVKRVVIGPQNDRPGTIEVGLNQSLLPVEGEACERIHQAGYDILFSLLPEVSSGMWAQARSKFGYK